MKKIVLFLSSVMVMLFSVSGIAETKIGVVDVNKVLNELPQVAKMKDNIKKKFDPRGRDFVALQNDLRSKLDEYKKNNTKLDKKELKKEQQEIIAENKKLIKERADLQRDLVAAQKGALLPILQDLAGVVGKIAKKQQFDVVINKTGTVYSNPKLEITDQVIAEMKGTSGIFGTINDAVKAKIKTIKGKFFKK